MDFVSLIVVFATMCLGAIISGHVTFNQSDALKSVH